MLSERLLSAVLRRAGDRSLRLQPYEEPRLPAPVQGREYLLYVHIPFCTRLCPYCSFNRFLFQENCTVAYFKRLREEMRLVADQGFDCTAMYVGGGTPTVMVDELCETIDLAKKLFRIRNVSTETNPDHLTPSIVDPLVERVDRFSVGVQSFDDTLLKQMDRHDKYGSGEEIFERLQSVQGRFQSLNVDMIFNFPSQTERMLRRDVELVLASGAQQATFYPLMASPVVEEALRRSVGRVSYGREHRYYRIIAEMLAGTFEPASAWTFSRVGGGMIDEYIVDYEDYVGIGSGSFSFLDGGLYVNTFSLGEYGRRIGSGASGVTAWRAFGRGERMRYRFLMSLFKTSLDKAAFQRDFGVSLERGLPLEMAFMRLNRAFEVDDAERLTLSTRGRYLLVAMMRQFFIGVNNLRDQARAALPPEELKMFYGEGVCTAPA